MWFSVTQVAERIGEMGYHAVCCLLFHFCFNSRFLCAVKSFLFPSCPLLYTRGGRIPATGAQVPFQPEAGDSGCLCSAHTPPADRHHRARSVAHGRVSYLELGSITKKVQALEVTSSDSERKCCHQRSVEMCLRSSRVLPPQRGQRKRALPSCLQSGWEGRRSRAPPFTPRHFHETFGTTASRAFMLNIMDRDLTTQCL